jgi:hypothetical protein
MTPKHLMMFFFAAAAAGVLVFLVFFGGFPNRADKPGGGAGAPAAVETGAGDRHR